MVKDIIRDIKVLTTKSEKFIFKQDESLIDDLIDTAIAKGSNCAGLAAIQIGVPKRLIVVWNGTKFIPFINPIIVKRSTGTYVSNESCLSLDGTREVKRHNSITVVYAERSGKVKKHTFSGFIAQVIQHECDHLNGVLIYKRRNETMTHKVLDGLSPKYIFNMCIDMKLTTKAVEGPLNFNNIHYWDMGRIAFAKLHMLDNAVNRTENTFLGMEIRINYNNPDALEIKKKPKPQFVVDIDADSIVEAANKIKKGFENMFNTLRNIEIVKVIFNAPATIVIWSDGTKSVVKAQEGETFDKEKGLAMAICKKALGNQGNYNEVFKKWITEE